MNIAQSRHANYKLHLPAGGTNYSRGFTAIEIIIVMGVSLLLITALLRFLVAGYPLSIVTFLQSNSNETARVQLQRIAKEMRQLRYSDTGAYPLVEMSPQKMVFYANIDNDLETERVRYELQGANLERGVLDPTGTPPVYNEANETSRIVTRSIRNGTDDIFIYYSGNFPDDTTPLLPADITEVKYVQFRLLIDADPDNDPEAVEIVSQVQLRNLKTNLAETSGS